MTEHVTAATQMVSDELLMFYPTVDNDDDENDYLDEEYVVSSESESDGNNDAQEEELQTLSSQWFSSARYDYTQSSAFLNMGSGSPIDDLIESSTLRLLDWNGSITEIQLGMRFVDKVQAISVVRKWSIWMGREYRVMKSKSD
ncbi:hypothetical protein M9H77_31452 [Catharanthus roseus]|uniref:Uncharacterized protein n=1 Tax=Catharanthus roseus TaxID=4058 RepID=A0ACC0A052_CATRO|nr:hypothetical protein M9H77_31452 [Catharanthus roseus]